MKKILTLIVLAVISCTGFAQQKQQLKVLYVGGSTDFETFGEEVSKEKLDQGVKERTAAFEQYLKKYFSGVKAINGMDYKPEMSADYDVTIFDGEAPALSPSKLRRGDNGISIVESYRPRCIPDDFNYPAILLADMGEEYGRAIGTKTDWYCLCLDADAHHFNVEHPIFKGPYKTKLTIVDKPTPEDAYHYKYFYDGEMPDTLTMWKVQTKGYITDRGFRVGMVSRPWGFCDSPDAEMISSGVCAKTLDAVAIGRHGNFFFWGFSASPKYMTEEAKAVFANAVVYTAGLKGQRIIARKYLDLVATKEYIKEKVYLTSKESYDETAKMYEEFYASMREDQKQIAERKSNGEKISERDEMTLQYDYSTVPVQPYEEYLKDQMGNDTFDTFGTDTDAYHKYLSDNTPYLFGGRMFYNLVLDEDVKSFGIPNTDIRLLDKAISMLEIGEKASKSDVEAQDNYDKAKRILDRYTLCTFTKAADWRNWFDTNKDKIFFTQAGGWYFMVNNNDPQSQGNSYEAKALFSAKNNVVLPETSPNEPVAIGASFISAPGAHQYLVVRIKVQSGFHIYGQVSESDPFIATKINITLPDGYKKLDNVKLPAPVFYNNSGTTQYIGDNTFIYPIDGADEGVIKVSVEYQCCDSHSCLPPAKKEFELKTIFSSR